MYSERVSAQIISAKLCPAANGCLDQNYGMYYHRSSNQPLPMWLGPKLMRRNHALAFILRSNSDQPRDSRQELPLAHFLIGMHDPERLKRLVAENVVPVVGLRSADAFQGV